MLLCRNAGEGAATRLLDVSQKVACEGCHQFICDRYLLRLNGRLWHESCVMCAVCKEPLRSSCFLRHNKLYCRRDYDILFVVRCSGCSEAIRSGELVMRARECVFHLDCFCCCVCACRLQKGDRCMLKEGRLLCARDFQELTCPNTSDSSKSDDDEEGTVKAICLDHGIEDTEQKRPKRPRTILTTQQRRAFKASFEISSKPCRKVRETLAAETGLSVRVVQVWFQNQRAKMKKLARRQQQQQPSQNQHNAQRLHSVPQCATVNSEIDALNLYPSMHQQIITLEQQGYKVDPFGQGLTPPQMPGDYMIPYGSEYSVMDSDSFCHLGDCLSPADPSLLNPIDRLCSMQDSYFTS